MKKRLLSFCLSCTHLGCSVLRVIHRSFAIYILYVNDINERHTTTLVSKLFRSKSVERVFLVRLLIHKSKMSQNPLMLTVSNGSAVFIVGITAFSERSQEEITLVRSKIQIILTNIFTIFMPCR